MLVSAGTERTLDCHAGYTLSSCSDLPVLWVTGTCLVLVRKRACSRSCGSRAAEEAASEGRRRRWLKEATEDAQPKKRLPRKAT